jgi:citrate lyase beta subunit
MNGFTALTTGPLLYVPGMSAGLPSIVEGTRFGNTKGIIVCLEDAVLPRETAVALQALTVCLQGNVRPNLYVRPRTPSILADIRTTLGAEKVYGVVLPKVTPDNWPDWAATLSGSGWTWMPTLETRHAFDSIWQRELRGAWLSSPLLSELLCVRVGGNDLLGLLGIRRGPRTTAYDTPLGQLLSQTVATFKPHGLHVAGPVCESLTDQETVLAEALLDVQHGLCPKAAIHPAQVKTIQRAYAVNKFDALAARQILGDGVPAVFAESGRMAETATHGRWAEEILARQEAFGTVDSPKNTAQRYSVGR